MLVPLSPEDEKVYGKLFASCNDLAFARYCLSVITKKKWHYSPWEKRDTVYLQQAAFTSALVVSYARVFIKSRGWKNLSVDLGHFDGQELACHDRIMQLRHSVFAHTDSEHYSVRPWRVGDFKADIVGAPILRITEKDAVLLDNMTNKLFVAMQARMKVILATCATEGAL